LPEIGSSHKYGDQFAGNIPMTIVEQGELILQSNLLGEVKIGNGAQLLDGDF